MYGFGGAITHPSTHGLTSPHVPSKSLEAKSDVRMALFVPVCREGGLDGCSLGEAEHS